VEGARLESVGVAVAGLDAFVGPCPEVFGAFDEHGGIHEDLGDPGKPVAEAALKKEIDEVISVGRLVVFVHGWGAVSFATPASSPGRTLQPRGGVGAPPVRQTIPLRSLVCLTGGLGLRGFYRRRFTLPAALKPDKFVSFCRDHLARRREFFEKIGFSGFEGRASGTVSF
jgi:hypothetical protein